MKNKSISLVARVKHIFRFLSVIGFIPLQMIAIYVVISNFDGNAEIAAGEILPIIFYFVLIGMWIFTAYGLLTCLSPIKALAFIFTPLVDLWEYTRLRNKNLKE